MLRSNGTGGRINPGLDDCEVRFVSYNVSRPTRAVCSRAEGAFAEQYTFVFDTVTCERKQERINSTLKNCGLLVL